MKRLWVALALLAAVGILSLGTSALAGKMDALYRSLEKYGFAPVPKTGQTASYALGDDGALQKGIPYPQPRFTINGDGTVTDNLTNLVWTQNVDLFDLLQWYAGGDSYPACEACNALSEDTEPELTDGSQAGDWRLPNKREFESLFRYGEGVSALPNTEGTGKLAEGDPFTNIQSLQGWYWSSTTYDIYDKSVAWVIYPLSGANDIENKTVSLRVWCVRDAK